MKNRKWKLIKEYPTSPILGTISSTDDFNFFKKSDYLDFWEEIFDKVKDYEILRYMNPWGRTLEAGNIFSKHHSNKIYQVKRLNDNTEFTIGDLVEYIDEPKEQWEIDNFFIREDGALVVSSYDSMNIETLNTIRKVTKRVIFTTIDGVEKYLGDTFYAIIANPIEWTINKSIVYEHNTYDPTIPYSYSTEEKAQNHILFNKPLFSLQEVIDEILNNFSHSSSTIPIINFEELAKNKINKNV